MALSAIHFLNWFYSFLLNRLSLICFCKLKKKKFVWKIRFNPTRHATRLTRLKMTCDLFDPTRTWPNPSVLPCLPSTCSLEKGSTANIENQIHLAWAWSKKPVLRYLEFSSLTEGLFSMHNNSIRILLQKHCWNSQLL